MNKGFDWRIDLGAPETNPIKNELADYKVIIDVDKEQLLEMIKKRAQTRALCINTKSHEMYIVDDHRSGLKKYKITDKNLITGTIDFIDYPNKIIVELLIDWRDIGGHGNQRIEDESIKEIIANKLLHELTGS